MINHWPARVLGLPFDIDVFIRCSECQPQTATAATATPTPTPTTAMATTATKATTTTTATAASGGPECHSFEDPRGPARDPLPEPSICVRSAWFSFCCESDKFGPLGASAASSRAPCPRSSLGAHRTTGLKIRRAPPEPQLRSRVSASKTYRFPCAEVANSSLPGPRVGPFRACARVRASTRACGKSECGLEIVFWEHEEHEVAYSWLRAFKMWPGNGVLARWVMILGKSYTLFEVTIFSVLAWLHRNDDESHEV